MRHLRYLAAALLPLALAATTVFAKNAPSVEPVTFGDTVYDVAGATADGDVISLSDLAIDRAKAEATVLELGADANDGEPVTLETAIADLPGLQDEGELDEDLVMDFVGRIGRPFALVPHADKVAGAKSLGDVVNWVMASENAPILMVAWSPRCPMCKGIYDERMHELVSETGTRLLVIASNYPDKAEHVQDYLEMNGYHWNVILDPHQRVTDRLGGKKTPHCFLLDADRKLRFRGSLDNDPRDSKEGDERKDYLRNAIEAVMNGGDIEAAMNETVPAG